MIIHGIFIRLIGQWRCFPRCTRGWVSSGSCWWTFFRNRPNECVIFVACYWVICCDFVIFLAILSRCSVFLRDIRIVYSFVGECNLFFRIISFCMLLNSSSVRWHTFSTDRVVFLLRLRFRCCEGHGFLLDWFHLNSTWVIRFVAPVIIYWWPG